MTNNLEKEIKYLCKRYHINPARSRGQNFVIDEEVLNKIIKTAKICPSDLILEVGSGLGGLTNKLLGIANNVMAVELDDNLFQILKKLKKVNKNLILINNDILKIKNEEVIKLLRVKKITDKIFNYKIVANIPYNITSFFLRKFLSYSPKPKLLILLLQKEIAERLVARPGQMSLLSISCQFYAEPKIIEFVSKESFWPKPEVDSAIVSIETIDPNKKFNLPQRFKENKFWQLIKIGFSARRKQLKNNLVNGLKISNETSVLFFKEVGLKETVRAQELAVNDWLRLYKLIYCKK